MGHGIITLFREKEKNDQAWCQPVPQAVTLPRGVNNTSYLRLLFTVTLRAVAGGHAPGQNNRDEPRQESRAVAKQPEIETIVPPVHRFPIFERKEFFRMSGIA